MRDDAVKEKTIKLPLYVNVYETISGWLKDGLYKPGDRLPGESVMAEQLNVSRGTLRQAMLLLQEDGVIMNHQGRGNIVLSNQDLSKSGLEKINNPIADYCNEEIDRIKTSIVFEAATQKHQKVLKLRPSSLVAMIEIIYYSGEIPIGYASIYMPYEVLTKSNVDFENTDTVYQYYSELLVSGGLYSESTIRMTKVREKTARILEIEENERMFLMEEVIYSEYDTPILSQKLFFSPEHHEFVVRRKNDRIKGNL